MKRYFSAITFSLISCLAFQSCDKGFEEINTNPNSSDVVNPTYTFTKAQLDGTSNVLTLLQGTMQYTTSFNDVAGFGAKYILSQSNQTFGAFTNGYPREINEISDVIRSLTGDNSKINQLSAARVWRAFCFSRLTDLYGDIPYSQAAQGVNSEIYAPLYDAQQNIYQDILKELEESATAFNVSNNVTFGNADLIYAGDVGRWKKFAYSLMLRTAMRMTKVDPVAAESWARKAIAGGVITEDADIAKMTGYLSAGQDINKNPLALWMLNSDYVVSPGSIPGSSNPEGGKYQDAFINALIARKDPRLAVFSVVYINGVADTSMSVQKGMSASLGSRPADFITYSEPNQATILQTNSPYLLLTNTEVNFLLAEAALRGWYTAASPTLLYENGIRASMRQWGLFGAGGNISELQISTYVNYNKLSAGAPMNTQLKEIYTQFWLGVFPNSTEAYATYRRTGYPELVPNNYVGNGTQGQIPRRMLYPLAEQNLNGANYRAAVARQGPDLMTTRVWWDKAQ